MEQHDRFSDALLRDDLRRLNSHLPKNRRTLGELLSDPAPRVQAASGDFIRMKKAELEEMSRTLPAEAGARVRLPIVLLRRGDLGLGAFTVLGDSTRNIPCYFSQALSKKVSSSTRSKDQMWRYCSSHRSVR